MKLVRKTRDKESREFWQFVEKTPKEVESWPDWMNGGSAKSDTGQPKQEAQTAGTVRMPSNPPKTPACREPFDVPFLQLAITGKADYLVTGDKDLLTLASKFFCPIITADQLLTKLENG